MFAEPGVYIQYVRVMLTASGGDGNPSVYAYVHSCLMMVCVSPLCCPCLLSAGLS